MPVISNVQAFLTILQEKENEATTGGDLELAVQIAGLRVLILQRMGSQSGSE